MDRKCNRLNCKRLVATTSLVFFMAYAPSQVHALSLNSAGRRGPLASAPSTSAGCSSTTSPLFQRHHHRQSIINSRGRQQRASHTNTCLSSSLSSTMPHADLAVRLDQPVLSPTECRSATAYMWKSILAVLVSDVFKTACVAFLLAFVITIISKSSKQIKRSFINPFLSSINHCVKLTQGRINRIKESFHKETDGVPMNFSKSNNAEDDGWGVCTLASKKPIGRSQYMKYKFKLPKPENVIQLALGQQLTLCCLDKDDNISKKSYFSFTPKNTKGHFSIVASSKISGVDEREMTLRRAKGESDFTRVLATELEIGDEIALQPGPRTLDYKGEYLPVTDMVYFASGDGIVPVIDQLMSVLPPGSSSVKGVSVIWTNDDEKDFDIALSNLEDEYFKYSTKLAVSCVVDESSRSLWENSEVDEAVPMFNPGTMAVVSGPRALQAKKVLTNKGYPETCICVLPYE